MVTGEPCTTHIRGFKIRRKAYLLVNAEKINLSSQRKATTQATRRQQHVGAGRSKTENQARYEKQKNSLFPQAFDTKFKDDEDNRPDRSVMKATCNKLLRHLEQCAKAPAVSYYQHEPPRHAWVPNPRNASGSGHTDDFQRGQPRAHYITS